MALDYIISGLQFLSVAVNALALSAFRVSPGLRATANRFVINLLVANIFACVALTPALWLNGGLNTRFQMGITIATKPEEHIHHTSDFDLEAEIPKSFDDKLIDAFDTTTVKSLHHNYQHHHNHGIVKRDVEEPDFIETDSLNRQNVKESVESVLFERDERGNVLEVLGKKVVDIQHGNGKEEIEIIAEVAASEPVANERQIDIESIVATFTQRSSMDRRTHTVSSENALIFDCTRFWGFDFAAAVGKLLNEIHVI